MKTMDEIMVSGAADAPILAVRLLAGAFGENAAEYAMSEIDGRPPAGFSLPVLLGNVGRVDILRAIIDAGPPAWLKLKVSKSMWLARLLREPDDGELASLYRHVAVAAGVMPLDLNSLLHVACEVYPDHPDIDDLAAYGRSSPRCAKLLPIVRRIQRDMREIV